MVPCQRCGVSVPVEVKSILVEKTCVAVVDLKKSYCVKCAGERLEELRKILKKTKNLLAVASYLKRNEEIKILEG